MKKALKIVGGLFAVFLLCMIAVYIFINSIAQGVVEKAGSHLLGTQVTLRAIDIRPFAGHVDFQGFRIANPEGFSDSDAVSIEHFSTDVDVSTLLSDKIIVKEVLIDGVSATWDGITGENHQKILENMKAFIGAGEATEGTEEKEPVEAPTDAEKKAGGKNVVIRHASITNTKVKFGLGDLDIPDQEFKDIGENGESLNETLLGAYEGFVNTVNGITSAGGKVIDGAGKALDGAGKALDDAGSAIKGLFK